MDSTSRTKVEVNLGRIAELQEDNQRLIRSFLEEARIAPATKIQYLNALKDRRKERRETAMSKNERLKTQVAKAQQTYMAVAEERLRAHSCLQSLFHVMKEKDCQCLLEPKTLTSDGKNQRLLDVVCDLQLEVHRLARLEMDQLEAQELDPNVSFIKQNPHPKIVDSERVMADWTQQNNQLQALLTTAATSTQPVAGPAHNKAAANSHDTLQDKLNLTVKLDELAGQVELQNIQLQEDLESRKHYLNHEQTMKNRFDAAIRRVVDMMKDMCRCDSNLEEQISARFLTYTSQP